MVARDWHRLVGGWQLIGGAITAVTFLDRTPRADLSADTKLLVYATVLPLSLLSALAGWALVRGHALTRARRLSVVLWTLQLVGVRVGDFAYRLALGPYCFLNIVPGRGVGVTAQIQPHVLLFYTDMPGETRSWLIVNLLAASALLGLWLARTAHGPTAPSGEPTSGPPAV
jgi:hypothetical protein